MAASAGADHARPTVSQSLRQESNKLSDTVKPFYPDFCTKPKRLTHWINEGGPAQGRVGVAAGVQAGVDGLAWLSICEVGAGMTPVGWLHHVTSSAHGTLHRFQMFLWRNP